MKLFLRSFIAFLFSFFLIFLFTSTAFALTTSYLVTEGLSLNPPQITRYTPAQFWTNIKVINLKYGDKLIVSSNSDGTGNMQVADILEIYNAFAIRTYNTYSSDCRSVSLLPPQDFSSIGSALYNNYIVGIRDWCGNAKTIGRIYIVHISADPSPTSTPIPTPTPQPTPTPIPTPILTPTPTPIPKTPLILIPGIGGSELKTAGMEIWSNDNGHGGTFTDVYAVGEKVWVNNIEAMKPGDDDYFDILRMESDGITSKANLELTGGLFDGYQSAINFFISNGYELNKDFFLFPYDWRKDIILTAPLLDQKINEIRTQTGSQKVDIVAHSMGGLVARNYISDLTHAQNVRKLFTLGTPHLGSVDALKVLRYGKCLYAELKQICFTIAPSEVNDITQNMISAFELVPTQKYYDFYSGEDSNNPYLFNDVDDIDDNGVIGKLDYSQTKTLLDKPGHNTALFYPAENFHKLDAKLVTTNGVKVYNIVGSGLPTLGQISERRVKDFFGFEVSKKDEAFVNGDKTVPLMSASLIDYKKSLSLLGDAKVYYTRQEHGGLVSSGSALLLVRNILKEDNTLPDGISITPYSFKGTIVSGHSPISLDIYDSSGNHTGLDGNGDIEENIPGSFYDTLDDAKFIYLPDDGNYSVKIVATDQGSFDLNVRKYDNSENVSIISYSNVPLTTATQGELTLNTLSPDFPTLQIDGDGDNSFETQVYSDDSVTSTSTPAPTSTPTPTSTSAESSSGQTSNSSPSISSQNTSTTIAEILNPASFLGQKEDDTETSDIKEVAGIKTFEQPATTSGTERNHKESIKIIIMLIITSAIVLSIGLMVKWKNKITSCGILRKVSKSLELQGTRRKHPPKMRHN